MIDNIYCSHCDRLVKGRIASKKETLPVKGENITIESSVAQCTVCGNEVFVEELDGKNLELAFAEYRKRHELLAPSEIVRIREKYGLSQRSLSKVLGWGEITVHRYESGSLQDKAHDDLLRLIDKPENLLIIYEKQGVDLPTHVNTALRKRIDDLLRENCQPNLEKALEHCLQFDRQSGEFTGYCRFDLEKIKNIILHMLAFKETFRTKINKLLWYTDFLNYQKFSVSISGNSYTHKKYGPAADDYELILGVMLKDGLIKIDEVETHGEIRELFSPMVQADKNMFSNDEIAVMDFVLNTFKDFGCSQISEYSHKEIPYINTVEGEKISYLLADQLSLKI